MGNGKRHLRFNFPSGTPLHATDEAGRPYARPWEEMGIGATGKGAGGKDGESKEGEGADHGANSTKASKPFIANVTKYSHNVT